MPQVNPLNINQTIVEFIDSGQPFALALILKAEGSTPAPAGMKAVIDATGHIWGTVGGGLLEAESQRRGVQACRTGQADVFDFSMGHGYADDRTPPLPICGGTLRLLIDPGCAAHRECYVRAAEAPRQGRPGALVTRILTASPTMQAIEVEVHWFDDPGQVSDSVDVGACIASESPRLFVESRDNGEPAVEVFVEPIAGNPRLIIAGGGHVGQAVARLALQVGFDVTIVDDRPEFADPDLFPAGVTTHCGTLRELPPESALGPGTYIALMTRGYMTDAELLEEVFELTAASNARERERPRELTHHPSPERERERPRELAPAYIGMIGSRRKVALVREHMLATGKATEAQLERVHAPIGIDIGAITVPEIAVSVVAELIAVRRKAKSPTTWPEAVAT